MQVHCLIYFDYYISIEGSDWGRSFRPRPLGAPSLPSGDYTTLEEVQHQSDRGGGTKFRKRKLMQECVGELPMGAGALPYIL